VEPEKTNKANEAPPIDWSVYSVYLHVQVSIVIHSVRMYFSVLTEMFPAPRLGSPLFSALYFRLD